MVHFVPSEDQRISDCAKSKLCSSLSRKKCWNYPVALGTLDYKRSMPNSNVTGKEWRSSSQHHVNTGCNDLILAKFCGYILKSVSFVALLFILCTSILILFLSYIWEHEKDYL